MKKLVFSFLFIFFLAFIISCNKETGGSTGLMDATSFSSSGGSSSGGSSNNPGAGVMTAGEWNDLANWPFWNNLLLNDTLRKLVDNWNFHPSKRFSVIIRSSDGRLLHDVKLTASNGQDILESLTDQNGRAEFFPGLFGNASSSTYDLKAIYEGQSQDLGTINASTALIEKTVSFAKHPHNNLDIMFVVDATGSMGDELSYLKNELADVINRAGTQLPGVTLRMSGIFYRDNGDDYVTRPFAFTNNVNQLIDFIKAQNAGGGGDFPEAVDEALKLGTQDQGWSSSAINRIIFLILDAPPHEDPMVKDRIRSAVLEAQKKGIRIIPVSASGIDRSTEFFLRGLSISTNSTYVFITNDSGIGNPHLTPTVGNYTVEYLNNLMVRLITKYGKDMD